MKICTAVLAVVLSALPAFGERTLSWDAVDVKARLDDTGRLHVREAQSYVFDGDWNGGERIFRVERGQSFTLTGVSRVDPATGELIPLREGSLYDVDEYALVDDKTLRWRSRMPHDPPFVNERITYVIDYTLSNILVKRGDEYLLDHDFAFSERPGEIRRFTLDLELDPAWDAGDLQRRIEVAPLPAGRGVVVRHPLRFQGEAAPEARRSTLPMRLALAALVAFVPFVLWRRFVRHEQAVGRFTPLVTRDITPSWIEQNLLPLRAEVVGAAWDEAVGANEVSALIARWAAEGKVTTEATEPDELVMHLNVRRHAFTGYERKLIDELFFDGDVTSTSAVKEHYKSSGFSPTVVIGDGVLAHVAALAPMTGNGQPRSRWPSVILSLASAALVISAIPEIEDPTPLGFLWAVALFWGLGIYAAITWRGRIDRGREGASALLTCIGIVVTIAVALILSGIAGGLMQLGYAAVALLVANNVLNFARSRKGPAAIAFRKRLASARQYFIDELAKSDPAIDDRWFPYVIAFGLDHEASAWMQAFGGTTRASATHSGSSRTSSTSSSSSSGPQWTGGGGAFGGAGATGSWGAALGGIAAGVAGQSSSSGGGGGGGGSSSGGGGGGGW